MVILYLIMRKTYNMRSHMWARPIYSNTESKIPTHFSDRSEMTSEIRKNRQQARYKEERRRKAQHKTLKMRAKRKRPKTQYIIKFSYPTDLLKHRKQNTNTLFRKK